jgi:hypothetical protein
MRAHFEIDIEEVDGKETSKMNGRPPHLTMRSHLIKYNSIVLEQEGKSITVPFDELEAAVRSFAAARKPSGK